MSPEGKKQSVQDERVKSLRLILEREQGRPVSYDEALEVGDALVSFFGVLAESAASDG
jgi:hypothetical protein